MLYLLSFNNIPVETYFCYLQAEGDKNQTLQKGKRTISLIIV